MSADVLSPDEVRTLGFISAMLAATSPPVVGVLYRHRDRDGALLYIGVTDVRREATRQQAHSHTARWWSYVDRIDREEFPSRREASRAELRMIQAERPIFNRTVHNGPDQPEREAAYLAQVGATSSPPPEPVVRPAPRPPRVVLDLGEYLAQISLRALG